MDHERLQRRLVGTFVAELDDHLRALERDLLALEKTQEERERVRLFESLLRTMHTLKGAAASVGAAPIVSVAHRLEEIFLAAGKGSVATNAGFFDAILPSVDAIADAGRKLKSGEALNRGAIAHAVERLAAPGLQPRIATPTPPSGSAEASLAHGGAPRTEFERDPEPMDVATGQWLSSSVAETVRIPAAKLDELLARSGELLTTRHRFDDRHEAAVELLDLAGELGKTWRRAAAEIGAALRVHADDANGAAAVGGRSAIRPRRDMDKFLGGLGDLVSRLERGVQAMTADLGADRRALHQTSAPLDAEIRGLRMLPFANACDGLERLIRDLTSGRDKRVELEVLGGEIELDRSILEGIKEALLHIVRNAIDHGIETVSERLAQGKAELSHVMIKATLDGQRVHVSVTDDGRGIDLDAIRGRLRASGRPIPEDRRELMRTILLPGFSTAKSISTVSGRGVGLDVVATRVAGLRGSVDIESETLRGTCISITLPLTLTTLRAVLVRIGTQIFAIESTAVRRVLRIGSDAVKSIEGYDAIVVDDRALPVASLAATLGIAGGEPIADRRPAVMLMIDGRAAAFTIDEALAERELLVMGLGARLKDMAHVAGASILSDGRIGLILDAGALIGSVLGRTTQATWESVESREASVRKRLLVADDSFTVRMLEKSILEAEGYDVVVAANGNEAWQLLLGGGIDLVVSDVEMPGMDGFSLTESIRASNRYRALPVILVTGKESDADKARGMAVGASAYLLKSAFDQKELLATIAQIL